MPKKSYRKRRRFTGRIVRIATSDVVGALAAGDLVAANILPVSTNVYRLRSLKLAFAITDLPAVVDDGQEIGIAHGDYSAAEIEEALEANTALDIGNIVEQEQARRKVRSLGIVQAAGAPVVDGSLVLNGGRPIRIKMNWLIGIGDTVKVWVRNGSDTVYTTGANIQSIGTAYVYP